MLARLFRLRQRRHARVRLLVALLGVLLVAMIAAGCGDDGKDDGPAKEKLVVYSGRDEELAGPIYEQFEKAEGVELEVRYAQSPELAAQIAEEGDNSPADVFYAQDAGAVGSIEGQLADLPADLVSQVPERFRDPAGTWVGVTGRVRVLAYNTDMVDRSTLPDSVLDMNDPKYKGKVGVAPTNASFQAFITGMRLASGDEATRQWLDDLVANDPKIYEGNGGIVDAIGAGEVEYGLVNHYYLYNRLEKDPDLPIANHFFKAGDVGTMVNASAVGILATTEKLELAQKFVAFMLDEAQVYTANDAPEREYPLVAVPGTERANELPPLDAIRGPQVDLSRLGDELEATVRMIQESGLGEAS